MVRIVIAVYISFIRGTPVLIQIFLVYYVLLGAFVLYFLICFAGSQFSRWLEARNQLKRA